MNSDASEDSNDTDNACGPEPVDPSLPPDPAVELNKRPSESVLPKEATRLLNQKRRRRNKKNKR